MKVTPQILLALTLAIRPIAAGAAGLGAGGYCDILNPCDKGLECTYDRGRLRCHTPCKPYNGGWCPRGSTCYANSDYSEGLCLYCRKHGEDCEQDYDCCSMHCSGKGGSCLKKKK
ncbi:unnamed protein product [Zymoseptoria tritici ST99CH_3D1]|nr:unnamed protein product [Zymoseptoria tritici ST99CH_3D1]